MRQSFLPGTDQGLLAWAMNLASKIEIEPEVYGLSPQQAEQLLNSAASDEKAVQAKHQPRGQNSPPPGVRDW